MGERKRPRLGHFLLQLRVRDLRDLGQLLANPFPQRVGDRTRLQIRDLVRGLLRHAMLFRGRERYSHWSAAVRLQVSRRRHEYHDDDEQYRAGCPQRRKKKTVGRGRSSEPKGTEGEVDDSKESNDFVAHFDLLE